MGRSSAVTQDRPSTGRRCRRGFSGLRPPPVPGAAAAARGRAAALVRRSRPCVGDLDYAVPVLLVLLLVVVAVPLLGRHAGRRLPRRSPAHLLLNWFFTPPFRTLAGGEPSEQVIVLVVYSWWSRSRSAGVVDVARAGTPRPPRARAEAEALSGLAGAAARRAPDPGRTCSAQVRRGVRHARRRRCSSAPTADGQSSRSVAAAARADDDRR